MATPKTHRLYVSGYNNGAADAGIHVFDIDVENKSSQLVATSAGVESPSFIEFAGQAVYAASEAPDHGGLAHYIMNAQGVPELQDQVSFSGAAGTCYVLTNEGTTHAYGADYNSGSISSCKIDAQGALCEPVTIIQHEGHCAPRLKDDPYFDRQTSPHVHTLSFIPGTNLLAAVDLGLDLITIYQTDETGQIVSAEGDPVISSRNDNRREMGWEANFPGIKPVAIVEAPLFSGPRIIAYHPSGRYAALICEIGCELIIWKISEDGLHWTPVSNWNLLQDAPGALEMKEAPRAAHVQFTNDGRFIYTSTRGIDQLMWFEIDEACDMKQRWSCPCGGGTPRHFALSPDDEVLAVGNKTGNSISIFTRDANTGMLEQVMSISCPQPSCVVWGD